MGWLRRLYRKVMGKQSPGSLDGMILQMETLSPGTDTTKPGLDTVIQPGQKLPWRGLWFNVEKVGKDAILLRAEGTTWKRHKEIQKSRAVLARV